MYAEEETRGEEKWQDLFEHYSQSLRTNLLRNPLVTQDLVIKGSTKNLH
jgi:hypothetical protein